MRVTVVPGYPLSGIHKPGQRADRRLFISYIVKPEESHLEGLRDTLHTPPGPDQDIVPLSRPQPEVGQVLHLLYVETVGRDGTEGVPVNGEPDGDVVDDHPDDSESVGLARLH